MSTSFKYVRINSDEFQNKLSAILELFEEHEYKEQYGIVETYEPLEIEPLEQEHIESFNLLPMRKRYLNEREKLLIAKYLKNKDG